MPADMDPKLVEISFFAIFIAICISIIFWFVSPWSRAWTSGKSNDNQYNIKFVKDHTSSCCNLTKNTIIQYGKFSKKSQCQFYFAEKYPGFFNKKTRIKLRVFYKNNYKLLRFFFLFFGNRSDFFKFNTKNRLIGIFLFILHGNGFTLDQMI